MLAMGQNYIRGIAMSKEPELLFKYRKLSSETELERCIDIVAQKRLYFPTIDKLNDRLEAASVDIRLPVAGYQIAVAAERTSSNRRGCKTALSCSFLVRKLLFVTAMGLLYRLHRNLFLFQKRGRIQASQTDMLYLTNRGDAAEKLSGNGRGHQDIPFSEAAGLGKGTGVAYCGGNTGAFFLIPRWHLGSGYYRRQDAE